MKPPPTADRPATGAAPAPAPATLGYAPVTGPWYAEVTRYQWLALIIASAGWVFDAFEGQLFNITRGDMLPELLQAGRDSPEVKRWGDRLLAVFLVGGTLGGVLFGSLGHSNTGVRVWVVALTGGMLPR